MGKGPQSYNSLRELNRIPNATYETYHIVIENPEPEICANALICLIKIVTCLQSQQIRSLEQSFLKEGELQDRMTRARIVSRKKQ